MDREYVTVMGASYKANCVFEKIERKMNFVNVAFRCVTKSCAFSSNWNNFFKEFFFATFESNAPWLYGGSWKKCGKPSSGIQHSARLI